MVTDKVMKNVENMISNYGMINNGDIVVIGVSGGADSVTLLHIFSKLKDKYNLNIIAAHINHKIRVGSAERDAKFVEDLCNKWVIEYRLKEAKIPELAKEWKVGEEEAGRIVRYSFFSELANGGKIATAHNANDNAETILMRMMRGSGLKGLGGIQPKSTSKYGTIIRPILAVTRDEIEEYMEENGLTHIMDETNLEEVYTRNKIRLSLIPYIKNTFNPNIIGTLNDNIQSYNEDYDYIAQNAKSAFDDATTVSENNISMCVDKLSSQHPSIAKRMIMLAFEQLSNGEYSPSSSTIASILNCVNNKNGTEIGVFDKYCVRLGYGNVIFEKNCEKEEKKEEEIVVTEDTNITLENYGVNVNIEFVKCDNIVNTPTEFYIPVNDVYGKTVTFRCKQENDVVRVKDGMHKRLSRYMCDKKIDRKRREEVLLVTIGNEVYCAYNEFVTRFTNRSGKFVKFTIEQH